LSKLWLGEASEAVYGWLGKASEKEVGDLIEVGQDTHFVALHSDQRFQALVKQMCGPQ
jgi:translation elongation factor EF-Ts